MSRDISQQPLPPVSPEVIRRATWAFTETRVLATAMELDLFTLIDRGANQPAELAAAAKALTHARILRRRVKTRILRVTWLDGKETKTVVWENGRVLDPTILPWYWRVFRWVFITERKAEKK